MADHHKLSASGSKRWFACPGSVVLEAALPDRSNTFSDDGTAMHAVAAWCLTEHYPAVKRVGDRIPVHREGEEPRHVEFTDEMADLVQGYVNTVRKMGIGCEQWVEQVVDFGTFTGIPGQFGTADFIAWDDRNGELIVADLKTGYIPTIVDDNSQLQMYALGALKRIVEQDAPVAEEDLA
jgi:hypothetical protein